MAIDRDIRHRTAVSMTYARTGNTLHCRERHGVKDLNGVVTITFDETKQYIGPAAIDYLKNLKGTRENLQRTIDSYVSTIQPDIDFITNQIDEIEAL